MKKRKIVITGRGVVNPAGNTLKDFWDSIVNQKNFFTELDFGDDSPVRIGAKVKEFDPGYFIPKRVSVKTDLFTHYFLAALFMAKQESNLVVDDKNREEIGIFYGNNSGGWNICETGFEELFRQSYKMVNPWQATAWFPTAGQGYASIIHGIKGYSKTFVADRVSSAAALYHGIESLQAERNKAIIVGGSEAPLTSLGTICYHESGSVATDFKENGCKPFTPESQGIVLSEGAAAVIIEVVDNTTGSEIAEVKGIATNFYGSDQVEGVIKCMNKALEMAELDIQAVDLIIPEGNGDWTSDNIELDAINKLFGKRKNKLPVVFPKYYFGHQYGAAATTDVIVACLILEHNAIPCYPFINKIGGIFTDKLNGKTKNILVNSRTSAGVNYSFVVSKENKK